MKEKRTRIDIETIDKMIKERQEFNKLDLDLIDFYEKGVKIEIEKEIKDRFDFTGLLNIDFVSMRFWKIEDDIRFWEQ